LQQGCGFGSGFNGIVDPDPGARKQRKLQQKNVHSCILIRGASQYSYKGRKWNGSTFPKILPFIDIDPKKLDKI
jgi:hypothetical protein